MRSKKPASPKRTTLPRQSEFERQFEKDWDRLSKAGRSDMMRLKEVMGLLIANDGPLPPEWFDHPLSGTWLGARDCHVHGDFLLIYRLDEKANMVIFVRAGTHADLFE